MAELQQLLFTACRDRCDDGYTGVKPQHCYITCSPWHRPPRPLDCFYSNKLVQIEDTKIKTERGC